MENNYKFLYLKYKKKYLDLENTKCIYIKNDKVYPVEIVKEHIDVDETFYTIKFNDGTERQTIQKNLIIK
tara:strand:- start:870 stop:1079 length:210 start_codon:yes stop_codon:yes gene_type:complete